MELEEMEVGGTEGEEMEVEAEEVVVEVVGEEVVVPRLLCARGKKMLLL